MGKVKIGLELLRDLLMTGELSAVITGDGLDGKTRRGDWEADTIIGQRHRQAIVSMVERKSKFVRLAKVERNTAELIAHALDRTNPLVFSFTPRSHEEYGWAK